ncbi:MAG TPA: class I SAM-dependent methyltransferase [Blastocatellia bacterium]|nr:class I SAM-dependent methyltransferase [Blastocatellia bacterium]
MSHSLTQLANEPVQSDHVPLSEMYLSRKLAEAHPGMERLALERFIATLESQGDETARIERLLARLNRLVDLSGRKSAVVLGCGPRPQTVRFLAEKNFDVVGVEPVTSFVRSACEYLGTTDQVVEGAAERIPLADDSQHLVFCDSVLEHVVSPAKSLDEMRRVLAPGGVAFITTTNRHKFSIKGENGEYRYRFFNWLPKLVKECLVFQHLHYDPRLANYTQLPAVHWFTYSELCALGRQAGFAQFYSLLDLMDANDPAIKRSRAKRWALDKFKFNPWLRALALTQKGDTIIMLKK